MTYVDGFVIPLKKENIDAYRVLAEKGAKIWMEHGALDYKECILEDSKESDWNTTFEKSIHTKEGETVVFAYIVFKDRAHRDAVNAKVMADDRMKEGCDPNNMPFEFKRMTYGGFQTIVEGK